MSFKCTFLLSLASLANDESSWKIDFFIKLFNVRMADWDRFCLQYRHFTYQNPLTPASFGIDPYCATVAELFQATGIESNQRKTR